MNENEGGEKRGGWLRGRSEVPMKSDKAVNEVGRATNDDRRMETPNGFGEEGCKGNGAADPKDLFLFSLPQTQFKIE